MSVLAVALAQGSPPSVPGNQSPSSWLDRECAGRPFIVTLFPRRALPLLLIVAGCCGNWRHDPLTLIERRLPFGVTVFVPVLAVRAAFFLPEVSWIDPKHLSLIASFGLPALLLGGVRFQAYRRHRPVQMCLGALAAGGGLLFVMDGGIGISGRVRVVRLGILRGLLVRRAACH